ncbi:MAG: flippase-like domain-containing protein [archaeon]
MRKIQVSRKLTDITHHFRLRNIALLSFGFLIMLVVAQWVGFDTLIPIVQEMNPFYFALFLALKVTALLIWNGKWKLLVDEIRKVKFWGLFPITMTYMLVNSITPGYNVGGEPVRAYYLSKRTGLSISRCLSTAVMDTGVAFVIFMMITMLSMFYVLVFFDIPVVEGLIQLLFLVVILISGILLVLINRKKTPTVFLKFSRRFMHWIYRLKFIKKHYKTYEDFKAVFHGGLLKFEDSWDTLARNKKRLVLVAFLSILLQMIEYLKIYTLFLAVGVHVNFWVIIVVVTVAWVLGYFVFLPGGIGVVEAVMIAIFIAFGIDAGAAGAVTIVNRLVFSFIIYGFGTISFIHVNSKYHKK